MDKRKIIIIHCVTPRFYDKVLEKLDSMNCKWWSGNNLLSNKNTHWNIYKEDTCISLDDKTVTYANLDFYNKNGNEIISAEKFLESKTTRGTMHQAAIDFAIGSEKNGDIFYGTSRQEELIKIQKKVNNLYRTITGGFETVHLKSNNNVMSLVKRAFESKESKAIRELDLGDDKNNLNDEGLEEFLAFLWETADKDTKAKFLKMMVEANKK